MAFCNHCGAQVDDNARFCTGCGKPIGAATSPPPPAVVGSGLESHVAGALAYLVIPAIIFLVSEPYKRDSFVRFHSFQAIFFWAAWVGFWIVFNIIGSFTWALYFLAPFVGLAAFVAWCFVVYKAYNKERFKVPFIGDLAEKQAAAF